MPVLTAPIRIQGFGPDCADVHGTDDNSFPTHLDLLRSGARVHLEMVARRYIEGADVGAMMVSMGQAVAYRRFTDFHAEAEAGATAQGLGVLAGRFEKPWEWRRSNPR